MLSMLICIQFLSDLYELFSARSGGQQQKPDLRGSTFPVLLFSGSPLGYSLLASSGSKLGRSTLKAGLPGMIRPIRK